MRYFQNMPLTYIIMMTTETMEKPVTTNCYDFCCSCSHSIMRPSKKAALSVTPSSAVCLSVSPSRAFDFLFNKDAATIFANNVFSICVQLPFKYRESNRKLHTLALLADFTF